MISFSLLCYYDQIFFKQIWFSFSVAYVAASAFLCLQERVRTFIEDTSDKDVLVLNVQDPFQRLLLHGVCEVNMFLKLNIIQQFPLEEFGFSD